MKHLLHLRLSRILALTALLAASVGISHAQIRVDVSLNRSLFIRYEPLICTVKITNMTGAELDLADEGNRKWFAFQIENSEGTPVPPYSADYHLTPIQIGPGQSVERIVNITPLYPITEYGTYRVKAVVYAHQIGRYFSSNMPLTVDITEGHMIWQQTVGVPQSEPGGGQFRTITLLSHRLPDMTQLYLRIEDKDNGRVYCTHQLGKTVSFTKPDVEIGPNNTVNILQNTGPKSYLFTEIGLNGEVLQRKQYGAATEKPALVRNDASGEIAVVGGSYLDPNAIQQQGPAQPPPAVGARPVAAPGRGSR